MSTMDAAFRESVLRLKAWLEFLDHKKREYQAQMNRVRRSGTPSDEPAAIVPDPALQPGAAEKEDTWL